MTAVTTLLRSSDPSLVGAVKEVVQSIAGLALEVSPPEELSRRLQRAPAAAMLLLHLARPADAACAAELMREVQRLRGELPVVVLSDANDPEQELALLRLGAIDFLTRPLNLGRLSYLMEKHTLRARLAPKPPAPPREIEALGEQDTLLFDSNGGLGQIMAQVRRLARQDTTVLLGGETGTGKTRLARVLHELSPRRKEPFLTVNCGCLSESLIASEMFGHVRGAFTGADRDRTGKFAEVVGGTLLLDDIDALPLPLQAQLLRVVEERVFEAVGSNHTQPLRARLVIASNRRLEDEVKAGRFRADLYYRLSVVGLHLPPLRECRSMIPHVARKFTAHFAAANGQPVLDLTPPALRALQAHDWPGNFRELRNVIERAIALCPGHAVGVDDLPESFHALAGELAPVQSAASAAPPLARSKWEAEAVCIMEALQQHNQSRSRAAAALGISRMTLYRKLQRYGLANVTAEPSGIPTGPGRTSSPGDESHSLRLFRGSHAAPGPGGE